MTDQRKSPCAGAVGPACVRPDEDQQAKKIRDPLALAKCSADALDKASPNRIDDDAVAPSVRTLMTELAGIVRNTCRRPRANPDEPAFDRKSLLAYKRNFGLDRRGGRPPPWRGPPHPVPPLDTPAPDG